MKKLLLIFLVLFSINTIFSQDGRYCKTVLDCDGNPIVGVVVRFEYSTLASWPWNYHLYQSTNENGIACFEPRGDVRVSFFNVIGYHYNGMAYAPNISLPLNFGGEDYYTIHPHTNLLNYCTQRPVFCSVDDINLDLQVPEGYCLRKSIFNIENCRLKTLEDSYQDEGFKDLEDGVYMLNLTIECCEKVGETKLPVIGVNGAGSYSIYFEIQSVPNIDWHWLTSSSGIYTADADHSYEDPIESYNDPVTHMDIAGDGLEPMDANPTLGFTACGIRYNFPASSNIDQYKWKLSYYDNNGTPNLLIDNMTSWIPYDPALSYDIDFNNYVINGSPFYFLFGGLGLPGSAPLNSYGYQFCMEAEGECGNTGLICRDFQLNSGAGKPGATNGSDDIDVFGYEALKTASITVFPNPTIDIVSIKSADIIVSIEIFDSLGKLILTQKINDTKSQISVRDWQEGVYMIKTMDINNKVSFTQFVKQ